MEDATASGSDGQVLTRSSRDDIWTNLIESSPENISTVFIMSWTILAVTMPSSPSRCIALEEGYSFVKVPLLQVI